MKLKSLFELLPVSRRKYTQALENIATVVSGLVEADANHCQIETSLMREIAKIKSKKPGKEKNYNDPAFM